MNIKDKIQPGDFALVDSSRGGAKIVKYFMRSPTIWHDLWRMLFKKLEKPLYYHALMFKNKDEIIEQQWKCVQKSSSKILNTNNNLFVFRLKGITAEEQLNMVKLAEKELGMGYDILNCIGNLLSWLFFIKIFARYLQTPNDEICINRIARWAKLGKGETFGAVTHVGLTTHSLWKYIINHPEKFDIIYRGNPREDNKNG